jgi:hypothetical protein
MLLGLFAAAAHTQNTQFVPTVSSAWPFESTQLQNRRRTSFGMCVAAAPQGVLCEQQACVAPPMSTPCQCCAGRVPCTGTPLSGSLWHHTPCVHSNSVCGWVVVEWVVP